MSSLQWVSIFQGCPQGGVPLYVSYVWTDWRGELTLPIQLQDVLDCVCTYSNHMMSPLIIGRLPIWILMYRMYFSECPSEVFMVSLFACITARTSLWSSFGITEYWKFSTFTMKRIREFFETASSRTDWFQITNNTWTLTVLTYLCVHEEFLWATVYVVWLWRCTSLLPCGPTEMVCNVAWNAGSVVRLQGWG